MTTRAILFDVDGTLVDAGGAGRRALARAAEAVHGIQDAFREDTFTGRTDPEIVAGGFRRWFGRSPTAVEVAEIIARYLDILPGELASTGRYRVLPGIERLVDLLSTREDCVIGLCTGNMEAGARIKLERGGLNRFFRFGGFSSDSGDRAVLTRRAVERAEEAVSGPVDALVVGDSVHDFAAARACGCRVALVATGWTSAATLRALGPDLFFDSFEDWENAIAVLMAGRDGHDDACTVATPSGQRPDRSPGEYAARAARVIAAGGVVIHPTSTLYGLAGDALRPEVARRIGEIKGGRAGPFIVLVRDLAQVLEIVGNLPEGAPHLADRFWPGPLTLVLDALPGVPGHLLGPDHTIAVRVDPHPFVTALTAAVSCPILSTSANKAGAPPPGHRDEVDPDIVARADLFVGTEERLLGLPSTVVRVSDGGVRVLRAGAIGEAEVIQAARSDGRMIT